MYSLIVPGVIATSQSELDEMLEKVRGVARRIMLDIMDGEFVANHSLDFDFTVPADSGFEYEAHLMTIKPLEWIERQGDKVDIAIIHVETVEDIGEAVKKARKKGLKVTLALSPATPVNVILPYLDGIDAVLILTVEPGRYGAPFVPETLAKIRRLREINARIPLEVDGAMNLENVKSAKEAGATIFASGSYIMKASDPAKAIKELEEAASGHDLKHSL